MRVHHIGGRFFEESSAATRSSRHDGWIMVVLEDANILGATLKGISELANEDAARKLVIETMRSGKFHHLVAGLLVEMDKKWSIDSAEANAEWFAELTDPEDKAAILTAFTEALLNFFLNGAPSSTPSPIVSSEAPVTRRPNRKRGARSTATRADSGPTPPDGSQPATATA